MHVPLLWAVAGGRGVGGSPTHFDLHVVGVVRNSQVFTLLRHHLTWNPPLQIRQ